MVKAARGAWTCNVDAQLLLTAQLLRRDQAVTHHTAVISPRCWTPI